MRAVFLDRDGVILNDKGYMHRSADLKFAGGALSGLKILADQGFALIVVTNQSGIGRGYFSELQYQEFNANFVGALAQEGIHLTAVYHCPHAPGPDGMALCSCRKPLPGLLLRAIADYEVDPELSFMIGDRASDMAAGSAAGIPCCIVISNNSIATGQGLISQVRNLEDAAHQVMKHYRKKKGGTKAALSK